MNRAAPDGTPLMEAALAGSAPLVRLLLEHKADAAVGAPVSTLPKGVPRFRGRGASSIRFGGRMLRGAIDAVPPPQTRGVAGRQVSKPFAWRVSPLHCGAAAKQESGELPAHCAARGGHAHILELLAAAPGGAATLGAAAAGSGATPLTLAASSRAPGGEGAAALLIARGADVAAIDKVGNTAAHTAAIAGNAGVLRALLAAGEAGKALTAAANAAGRTPLHCAAALGRAEAVALLLASGADARAADAAGATPLHLVAKSLMFESRDTQEAAARALLAAGADAGAVDAAGQPSTAYAAAGSALRELLLTAAPSTSGATDSNAAAAAATQEAPAGAAEAQPRPAPAPASAPRRGTKASAAGAALETSEAGGGGAEALILKEALRPHTSEEPEGWRLGSEVARACAGGAGGSAGGRGGSSE